MKSESGFSLVELLVAMTVMLLISGAAVTAMLKLSTTQSTIWNRTQMHSGIRGATEVLQQEVGQAGRIALISGSATCIYNTSAPCLASGSSVPASSSAQTVTVDVTSICGMFIGEKLAVDVGANQETVTISQINTASSDPTSTQCPTGSTVTAGNITATFLAPSGHAQYTPLQALGGFIQGVIPSYAAPSSIANGSTEAVLKLFGDINADGNMVYVEYSVSPACICTSTCSPSTTTGNLYRNSMSWNSASKTPASASQILLGNVTQNPNGSTCFTYQEKQVGTDWYVTDVAVTLTVQTQLMDPVTKSFQTETKALLNVSPRNVFNTWELANDTYTDRNQGTPATITTLIAGPS
jgi:prepilin-type N-terminal cleavage/methylation domain-containing protein